MDPLRLDILDDNEYIKRTGILEVTSTLIKDSTTGKFIDTGLFSEVIFGELSSVDRTTRPGYINLVSKFLHPKIYKNLSVMKRYYADIMASKKYAIFDKKLHDFVLVDESEKGASTGYAFFIRHFSEIKFKPNNSPARVDKVKLLNKYKSRDRLLCNKWVVIPAALREYQDTEGAEGMEEINNLYISLISAVRALPEKGHADKLFDGIKFKIQLRINEIYLRLFDMLNGKRAFLQGKYSSRAVALGTRNVISSAQLATAEPGGIDSLAPTDSAVPVYEVVKGFQPAIIHIMKRIIFPKFSSDSLTIPAIDPDTLKLTYIDIDQKEHSKFGTSEGLSKYLTLFGDPAVRFDPLTVTDIKGKAHYLIMVHDTGDSIVTMSDPTRYLDILSSQKLSIEDLQHKKEYEHYLSLSSLYNMRFSEDSSDALEQSTTQDLFVDDSLAKYHNEDLINWRRETGIELIFDNVLRYQVEPLLRNWLNMSDIDKKKSDDFLLTMTGMTNMMRITQIITEYNKDVDEKVTLRPITHMELLTIVATQAVVVPKRNMMITRYPVNALGSIYPSRVKLASTQISRTVVCMSNVESNTPNLLLIPHYPILGESSVDSLQLHPSRIAGLNADLT